MSKALALYYSSYGHIGTVALAIAEGARSAGATVDVKRVVIARSGPFRRISS